MAAPDTQLTFFLVATVFLALGPAALLADLDFVGVFLGDLAASGFAGVFLAALGFVVFLAAGFFALVTCSKGHK